MPALAPVGQLPDGEVVDLPGRGSTYVYDSGPSDGPTFVLLHSLACTGLMTWYPALEMVREYGRVVVFDQRCHGQGITPPRLLLEDCADDVAALADVLGIRSVVPVGYSLGSLVAQLVWRRHPQRVDGLVLCAATAAVSRASYERLATGVFAALIDAVGPAPRRCDPAAAVAEGLLRDHQWLLGQVRATSPGGIARAMAEVVRFDSRSWVHEIDVPTAVVATMKDRAFGVARQRWLAEHIPGAELVPIDAGHAGCTFQPREFVAGLRRAIDSVHGRLPQPTTYQRAIN
ncbi:alpha/beta hydrolase [Mycobacterium sp. MYCO198283]|uniref:alpha/beta fold hydrolase n=1 Tax=Mycobacterium sp. MYCO198283 TaxID=2883505 RepID=UPI001E37D91A|nr:alpha/beta hydrolase [Mycobacterium sp. MYCO198283]MCG5434054.1 alpha/beta hydrolase [Mycobacterium sp. MYCO198283]